MAILSTDERLANRLGDLERRFDAFISQDKPGSQLFTANHIPFGNANGALTSSANLTFVDPLLKITASANAIVENLRLTNLANAADTGNSIVWNNTNTAFQAAFIQAVRNGAGTDIKLQIGATSNFTTTNAPINLTLINGNLGIGSTDPTSNVPAVAQTTKIATNSNTTQAMLAVEGHLSSSNGGIGSICGVNRAATGTDKRIGVIIFGRSSTDDSGNMRFYTRNAGTLIEAINIDIAGNVGIGGAPFRKLSIIAASAEYISFGTAAAEKFVYGIEGAGGASPYLTWYDSVAAQHRMRLGPDANLHLQNAVYIGSVTTAPSYQVHLSTDSAGKPSTNVWTVTSDDRTKATKKLFDHGLVALRELPKPIEFTYNGKYNTPIGGLPGVGYSAQELLPVAPKMVHTVKAKVTDDAEDEDEIYAVNTGAMQAMMHLAILELDDRLDKLEKKESNANGKT